MIISPVFLISSVNFSINGLKMSELVELGRRLKRSLDGKISYRKSAVITLIVLGKLVGATKCPRSLDPFYIVSDCIKWVKTSGTYSIVN